jgi:lysophospholipase L1-like esterase
MGEVQARNEVCENPRRLLLASAVMHPFCGDSFLGRSRIVCRLVGKLRSDASTLVPRAVGHMGIMLLAAMLTTMGACSPGAEREKQPAGREARQTTAHQGTTPSGKRAEDPPAPEGETTTTDSRIRWDYVALGDSLATGVGARRGYVPRYADHLQRVTGTRLKVNNLGLSGQTSTQLLHSIRNDPEMRKALGGAEIITLNIGLNDLGQARSFYESGTCGGPQNEACLREVVDRIEWNWDAIINEISSLRSTENTIIRTVGLGYTSRTEVVFRPYLDRIARQIASSAADAGIPYVEVRLADEGKSEDGLHPNDKGYRVIAERLGSLGYEPLRPR